MIAGILRYLQYTSTLDLSEAVRIGLGQQAAGAVKNLMFRLVEDMLERKLNTLKTGEGIL